MSVQKRIRDPIHGLIVFDLDDEVDKVAWKLIDTPEFQRLRRLKQLGLSEFTFPSATHTRFSHCVGVFHVARRLMKIAESSIPANQRREHRARAGVIAALLHDLGHGPFSHAFEVAEKKRLKDCPGYKDHEAWTAEIITSPELGIRKVLRGAFEGNGSMADDVANLLCNPTDIYSAVVTSSFDADRLDYLRRDRLMSGSGAGAIDFDWLIDNLRVVSVSTSSQEGDVESGSEMIQTFAFEERAFQAVEAFILARYHLYSQIYLHRVTRGLEQLLARFLTIIAKLIVDGQSEGLPLNPDHALFRYYTSENPTPELYLPLDDAVVWSAVEACVAKGPEEVRQLARRIRDRQLMKAITIDLVNPTECDKARRRYIDEKLADKLDKDIFVDRASLSIYEDAVREIVPPHKRVYIRRSDKSVIDIARLSKPVAALAEGQEILRYYFDNESDYNSTLKICG